MFDLGDDFEIDEENFLDEVLEAEKNLIKKLATQQKDGTTQNLETTRLNILKDSNPSSLSPDCSGSSRNENISFALRTSPPNTPLVSRECSSRKVRPRKFPGPAGLLPERHGNSSLATTEDFLNELEEEFNEESNLKDGEVLSQDSARILESPAWAELMQDLGPEGKQLLNKLNIASVCSQAKQSRALKVPFLALLIQNVDSSTVDPCLYLSDRTGEIVGAVHREVWEQLGRDLVVGTVIVLINVGVLCAGHTTSRHYLNITVNNIASIYSPSAGNDIRVVNMKPFSQPDCLKFMKLWHELLSTSVQHSQSPSEPSRQLFTTATHSRTPQRSFIPKKPSFSNKSFVSMSNRSFDISLNDSFTRSPTFQNSSKPDNGFITASVSRSGFTNCSKTPEFSKQNCSKPNNQNYFQNRVFNKQNMPDSTFQTLNHMPTKRPKYDINVGPSCSRDASTQESTSQAEVESLLDGIDTDSLFGDF